MNDTKDLILAFKAERNYKKFAQIAAESPVTIENLIQLCYTTKYPFPQYSSWLLCHVSENHFDSVQPYLPKFIDAFIACEEPSTQRNLGNALQRFPTADYRAGELLDTLFKLLLSSDSKVAMKVISMHLLAGFTKEFPELKNELKAAIEAGLETGSPAYHSAARKILKNISDKAKSK